MKSSFLSIFCVISLFLSSPACHCLAQSTKESASPQSQVSIGVVLDLNSPFGAMMNWCMDAAISDFYSAHPNFKTRLQLLKKDAESIIDATSAVQELVKDEEVVGIIGPQGFTEERFAAAIGEKAHLPIISFTSRSSDLWYSENRFFLRTTWDDAVQAQALAAICQRFQWPQVVVLYEENDGGNQFLSHLIKAFQDFNIGMAYIYAIPPLSDDNFIMKELNKVNMQQTKVFVVHASPATGKRLFSLANSTGMMSDGYAWIITDILSIFLNSFDSDIRDSMEGVVGMRPYVFPSEELEKFGEKWERNVLLNRSRGTMMEMNIYGLWAYDTVTALALAAENIMVNSTGLGMSYGQRLVTELSRVKFRGLAGDFDLVQGKLKPSAFEIINVIGSGERRVGFWTPDRGIIRYLDVSSTSNEGLKNVVWPGDNLQQPKGWSFPPTGKLRVGVPWKRGFKEFVNVEVDPVTNHTNATGFSIYIFVEAVKKLPFNVNYEFICYNKSGSTNWSYDEMLHKIPQDYDMVAADTTIWSPRSSYVDFSLPYSESGVILVVKNHKTDDEWIVFKPLRWDLWLVIIAASIWLAIVIRILERRKTSTTEESVEHQEQPRVSYWIPVTVLAFAEMKMVSNKWSFALLVCWLFSAYILMQSYTANLSAILTIDQLKFAFSDNYYVGYQEGSFMKQFLIDSLNIKESRLKAYGTAEDFHDAMSKGSSRGGIDAIFDEIPYMKLFLIRYESQYQMIGPTYRTDGLGLAFPRGSPFVAYFSRAILNVTEGPTMTSIEQMSFGPGYSSQDPLSATVSQGTSSLTLDEFRFMFYILLAFSLIALFCSEATRGQRFAHLFSNFIHSRLRIGSHRVHSMEYKNVDGETAHGRADDNHEFNSDLSNNPPPRREGREGEGDEEFDEPELNSEVVVAQNVGVTRSETQDRKQKTESGTELIVKS